MGSSTHRSFVRQSWVLVLVAAFSLIGGVVPVAAQTPPAPRFLGVVQSRSLTTYAYARDMDVENDTDDAKTSPNFGLFDATSRSSLNVSSAFAIGAAAQRSSFTASQVTARGEASMSTSISDPNWEVGTARATSTFSYTFRVNVTSSIRLRGKLYSASPSASNGGKVRVALTSAGSTLFSQQEGSDPYDESFDTVLRVSAGPLYTISAVSDVSGTSNQENTTNDSESAYDLKIEFLPTTAQFGLMSLTRTLDTHILATDPNGTFGDDDGADAPNTAAWNATVNSAWQQGGANGTARSRQQSSFSKSAASVVLQTTANGSVKTSTEAAQANANGRYELHFFIGARLTVRLKGTVTRSGSTATRIILRDSKGLTLWQTNAASYDQQIVLKPDRAYTLLATSETSASTSNPTRAAASSGAVTFAMTIVQP